MAYSTTIHPFPARMASEIALRALDGLAGGSVVLDPMCGSGVVVRRALDCGHVGIGLDIDPLAVLMTKVWTTEVHRSIQPDLGSKIVLKATSVLDDRIELPWIDSDPYTTDYVNYWFAPAQRRQIRALLAASTYLRGHRKDLVNLALSRIIITKSKGASLAADVSHSRPHKVRAENDFDIFAGFVKSLERLLRILRSSPTLSNGKVRLGDARTLRGIRPATVDLVVTSPPYINAIDYLRGHKLALVWLGYSTPAIRRIISLGVGATSHEDRGKFQRLNSIAERASAGGLPPDIARMVRRYVLDMAACLRQTHRVLKDGKSAVYVVSNSLLRGVEVDTASIIAQTAADAGLQLTETYCREIPRKHRYLPPPQTTTNSRLATRMRTETVLRFRKGATKTPSNAYA